MLEEESGFHLTNLFNLITFRRIPNETIHELTGIETISQFSIRIIQLMFWYRYVDFVSVLFEFEFLLVR